MLPVNEPELAVQSHYDRIVNPIPLLPHHAHLLRECAAALGARLLDHRLRRHCAAQAGAGHRYLVPDRYRRAWTKDRALGRAGRPHAGRVCHRHLRRVQRPLASPRHHQRRLHPHHGRPPQARRAKALRHPARSRLHLQGLVHRPILRLRRGIRGRPSRHLLPRLRAADRNGERGELLFQAVGLRAQAAGVL